MAMASGKSGVWRYFELVEVDGGNKKTQCQLCKVKLAYSGGTSSMRNHMKHVHSSISVDCDKSATACVGPIKRQTSLIEWQQSRQKLTKPRCVTTVIIDYFDNNIRI